ncbi:hypothetical protein ACWC09_44665 [Streptomyces sp. NPDC001617]
MGLARFVQAFPEVEEPSYESGGAAQEGGNALLGASCAAGVDDRLRIPSTVIAGEPYAWRVDR